MPIVQELFPEPVAGWARVAVDRAIDIAGSGLTYAVGPDLEDPPVGTPVIVPLGRGNTPTPGWIVERLDSAPTDPVKHVFDRRQGPPLPADLVELGMWIARYYLAPPGPTLSSMLPAPVRKGTGSRTRRYIDLAPPEGTPAATTDGTSDHEEHRPEPAPRSGPAQRRVLDVITALPATDRPVERSSLRTLAGIATTGPIDRLVDAGLLVEHRRREVEARWSFEHMPVSSAPTPTPAQQDIIDSIGATLDAGFSTHLLLGVTGSGKTEVYLRLVERVLKADLCTLILVPEIALTPQTGARLARRFPGEEVAILHSALPAAARHAGWKSIADGQARVVLGARSAVFAPIPEGRLGLVIVDEEHDGSFKQDTMPRYHGRDVAIRRAQVANCPILLGSATPSLESWHNATATDRATLHRLLHRAPGLTPPRVRVVNIAEERRMDRARTQSLGPTLCSHIDRTLQDGRQVLLMLNRRGWATYVTCTRGRCGWSLRCAHCDVTMVYHRRGDLPTGGLVRCHHCTREVRLPQRCPECGGPVARLGQGTQRIEEELAERWPNLLNADTMARVDSDTMHTARDFHDTLHAFQAGRLRLLLGTQMIAKGLDVPGVGLVGVIDADTALNLPDFRASERTCQLVHQVTGRVGRSSRPGTAVIQTMDPDSPAIALAVAGHFETFASRELTARTQANLPPTTRMARIMSQHEDLETCTSVLDHVVAGFRAIAHEHIDVMGPMTCPLARIRGRHRRELLLVAPSASHLQDVLHRGLAEGLLGDASLVIDVDPVSLL